MGEGVTFDDEKQVNILELKFKVLLDEIEADVFNAAKFPEDPPLSATEDSALHVQLG